MLFLSKNIHNANGCAILYKLYAGYGKCFNQMKMGANSGDSDNNAAVCCTKADSGICAWVNPLSYKWLHRFSAQRLSAYGERNADVPPWEGFRRPL